MNKICGYSCEHNKSGVCQISTCNKKLYISDKTEIQTFTRYIDPTITELQQENQQLKDNWIKLRQKIIDCFNKTQDIQFLEVLQDMHELESENRNE